MAKEQKNVVLIEDNESFQNIVKTSLEKRGHKVTVIATLCGALRFIFGSARSGNQADVAVVDGTLDSGRNTGEDGKTVVKALRKRSPNTKIIGMSGGGNMQGVDANMPKTKYDGDEMADLVNRL